MKLLFNLVVNDIRKNRIISSILFAFLMLSAVLLTGGLRIGVTSITSINALSTVAQIPDYIQMHKGDYDEKAIDDFVKNHDYIEAFQVTKMLNIKNSELYHNGKSFENSLMDNSFVAQNESFDYLLDMNNEIAIINKGEIGIPIYYAQELGIELGDSIRVEKGSYAKDFKVSTIIRDAQMNSALTSSKRLLINEADILELSSNLGEWEYCFEFLLEEGSIASLETDYIEAKLPSNGVGISGSLITMLNTFSHGIIIIIIMAISMLLIGIAFLCLSYIIRATLAEQSSIIGEMRAVGFTKKEIKKLYQLKYVIIAIVAGIIGYLGGTFLGDYLSESVILYYGSAKGNIELIKWGIPVIGVLIQLVIVTIGCIVIISRNLRKTVLQMLKGEDDVKREGHYKLPANGFKYPNISIAFGELKCKYRQYIVVFLVFIFSSFLILLPMNMKNTINHPSFMSYMGVGESDLRIDIQYTGDLEAKKELLEAHLNNDADIEKYAIYQYGSAQVLNNDGKWDNIRIESGNQAKFPLDYLEGKAPVNDNEIALSYLNAKELNKNIGENLTLNYMNKEVEFIVSGIYQDITYGGKTAKAKLEFNEKDLDAYIVYVNLKEEIDIEKKASELREILIDSKVTPVREFIAQTLGGISDTMGIVEIVTIIISLFLSVLITAMILKLIMAKEQSAIAIKKAIGFSNDDLRIQLGIRILAIQIFGIGVGTILANNFGEAIFGLMLSGFGASKIKFLINPIKAYLFCPGIQILAVLIIVTVISRGVSKYHIRNQIIE